MPVTDPDRAGDGFSRLQARDAHEIQVSAHQSAAVQGPFVSQDDFPGLRADLLHVRRMAERDAESLPLSDGIPDDPPVPAEHLSGLVHEIARAGVLRPRRSLYVVRIAAVRDEAHFLRIRLGRDGKAGFGRDPSDLVFRQFAQWHQRGSQLLLRQFVQHVRLVFFRVGRSSDRIPAVVQSYDGRVVPGRHVLRSDHFRVHHQLVPFDVAVALDARVGRHAADILLRERLHDVLPESLRAVHREVLDADLPGGVPRVVDIAAAAVGVLTGLPCAQSDSRDFISRSFQKQRRHGAVDSAGHADEYFIHSVHLPVPEDPSVQPRISSSICMRILPE